MQQTNIAMKNTFKFLLLMLVLMAGIVLKSNAQFSSWADKVKSKAQQLTSKAKNTADTATAKKPADTPPADYDFKPGDTVLYCDDFSDSPPGSMPASWKTNGAGKIIIIAGQPGKWLQLGDDATFKLKPTLKLPAGFTVEFDVLALTDQTVDLDPFIFGFAADNSVISYIHDAYNDNAIAVITLLYFNRHEFNVSSSSTKVYNAGQFDLTPYAMQVMHVALTAHENQLSVYLAKAKIFDAAAFNNNPFKYFFISAPLQSKNGAKIAIGNICIRGFKK